MNRARLRSERPKVCYGARRARCLPLLTLICCIFLMAPTGNAQQTKTQQNSSPRQTLVGALSAACRQNAKEFSSFLLEKSSRSFLALPVTEQKALLKRFSLTSLPGNPRALLDTKGRLVVQCLTPSETVTYGLQTAQVDRNVAFIPVAVTHGENTDFGLVHQPDGWRLFSLGLLVINVPTLVRQWEDAAMKANQQATVSDLLDSAQAIKSFHSTFSQWPDTLEQLGPAAPSQVSPQHAQLLSKELASGTTDGYRFRLRLVTGTDGKVVGFQLGAVPEQYGKTGRESYFVDEQGQLHAADLRGAPATGSDPIVKLPSQSS